MNEYEYEYDADEPANSQGDGSGYRGYSKYIDRREPAARLLTPSEDLTLFHSMTTQYNTEPRLDDEVLDVLDNIESVESLMIRNWDALGEDTGVIIRFAGRRNPYRSKDFRFNLYQRNFSRHISASANRLREEIDADLSSQDLYKLGGVTRYAGSTDNYTIQLLLTQIGSDPQKIICAYLVIADIFVVPLNNQWNLAQDQKHLIYTQALDQDRISTDYAQAVRNQPARFKRQIGEL